MPFDRDELEREKLDQIKAAQEERAQQDRFLDIIKMIESSGGKNFEHRPIEEGIHEGTAAIGNYGLMPNTVKEIAKRMAERNLLTPELKSVSRLPAEEMKETLEKSPELENKFARRLARRVLRKQQDPEKAAYSWMYGHNLEPGEIEQRDYESDPYVQKYRNFRKKMFGE